MVTNAFILYNWLRMERGEKQGIESGFRDELLLDTIKQYGYSGSRRSVQQCADSTIQHGSTLQSQDEHATYECLVQGSEDKQAMHWLQISANVVPGSRKRLPCSMVHANKQGKDMSETYHRHTLIVPF